MGTPGVLPIFFAPACPIWAKRGVGGRAAPEREPPPRNAAGKRNNPSQSKHLRMPAVQSAHIIMQPYGYIHRNIMPGSIFFTEKMRRLPPTKPKERNGSPGGEGEPLVPLHPLARRVQRARVQGCAVRVKKLAQCPKCSANL